MSLGIIDYAGKFNFEKAVENRYKQAMVAQEPTIV